ncbi:unnamed protein product [Adineta steineri]|uniref:Shisa N-terminal domain-containing protein n=1 Tax=Adineta steineri TaxID=433720 RepID=A0A814HVT1_9BILA|nr:unnamed protein product [Adineta steineri]
MTTSKSSTTATTIIAISKPPSTICSGFIDIHGIWNNGFACPIQNSIQYFCCGTDNYHYCCTPDRFLSDIISYNDQIFISGQYQSSNHIVMDQTSSNSLINNSNIINKQFEQFQKVFLPIFLLTSSILFLVGLAIWFWLYKHKVFYATERDDTTERNPSRRKTSKSIHNNDLDKKRKESTRIPLEEQSEHTSYPSTEV